MLGIILNAVICKSQQSPNRVSSLLATESSVFVEEILWLICCVGEVRVLLSSPKFFLQEGSAVRPKNFSIYKWGILLIGFAGTSGCHLVPSAESTLPSQRQVVRDQLVIHSDFHLPRRHRLLDELVLRRADISRVLELDLSDEPINVYLFANQEKFSNYMNRKHPLFPNRRAFFVKNDAQLLVYAYWGSRVGEDLRHEVTHGYVHSVVPNLPLWLDEGLAEYFETPRGNNGFNSPHVHLLNESRDAGSWQPDLERLEKLRSASSLTQLDYAESWLWAHFLLGDLETRRLVNAELQQLIESGKCRPVSEIVTQTFHDADAELLKHLDSLASFDEQE
jgi:hypothetical protein